MHLHVTDSILKDCLCDTTCQFIKSNTRQPMAFTAGETGLIFYCVNHLTFFEKNGHIFNAHLRVSVFKFPSLTFSPQGWLGVLISLTI